MGLKYGRGREGEEVFFVAFQDGGHDQCTSEFSLKNACSTGYRKSVLFSCVVYSYFKDKKK